MIENDTDDVNLPKIDEEINREFTNQAKGQQLIGMGFKVKHFDGCWNLIMASGYKVCKLDTIGTKREALEEAIRYVKVKKI